MNLLKYLVELLFFIKLFLIHRIQASDPNLLCTIEFSQDLNVTDCNIIRNDYCLNKVSNEACLNSLTKYLTSPDYIELENKETKIVFIINKTCLYFPSCPKCLKENNQICNDLNNIKNLNLTNHNMFFKIFKNKLEIYMRKNDSKISRVLGSFIIILIIAIVFVVVWKKGYTTKFKKLKLNEKFVLLKRRISIKNNKETFENSFQDLIGSYENLSDNTNVTQSNVQCINEFKLICTNSKLQEENCKLTMYDGKISINVDKNRFFNILPFDQSRVKLQRTIYDSDYINASYIPFFRNPSVTEYIAAQGPLPNTITDFWWMVWEQNVSVIVMLTKLFENGRIKCEQYWPSLLNEEEESEENSDFSVLLIEEAEYSSYTERKLKLTNKITSKWRNIIHLHMHTWSDFGVPNLEEFEKSLYRFREITSSDNSPPYVIHCSAGVGRTGTFITIDRIMKKVLSGKPFVNIYEEVLELRKYRSFMVQQKDQYIFIHKFIGYFLKKYRDKDNDCEIEENVYE